ncbi:hypothetical protein SAMN04490193_1851 [Pseudomonas marginalis]|nr:hypothetical protein SAMN04490193_1851 [Pseudomonas marginalis]
MRSDDYNPRRLTAFSDFLFDRWQEAPWDQ